MKTNKLPNKRIRVREPFQNICALSNGDIKNDSQTVDNSKRGLGILAKATIPCKKDDILSANINSLQRHYHAQVCWFRKDKNLTRLGLKVFPSKIHLCGVCLNPLAFKRAPSISLLK